MVIDSVVGGRGPRGFIVGMPLVGGIVRVKAVQFPVTVAEFHVACAATGARKGINCAVTRWGFGNFRVAIGKKRFEAFYASLEELFCVGEGASKKHYWKDFCNKLK